MPVELQHSLSVHHSIQQAYRGFEMQSTEKGLFSLMRMKVEVVKSEIREVELVETHRSSKLNLLGLAFSLPSSTFLHHPLDNSFDRIIRSK